ncbi:MAG TPA: carbon storage regulator CsrA [Steroidobacteraceae bacterium]|nr:carbon storage regulator CsrA [Steroidobacteraceae bacterium]
MLALTRRVGETLRIGADVTVTVLSMRGRHVRVGIVAPRSVTVHREELYERLRSGRTLCKSMRPSVVNP